MPAETADRTIRLRDVARTLLRYWVLFLVVVLLAVVSSVAYGTSVAREYTATATLVVSPITTNPFSSSAPTQTININTEREILRSSEVARIASESLGQQITADSTLLNQVDVAAPEGSQILQVSVKATTPEDAADYANALADAYLTFRAAGATEVAISFIAAIDDQLAALQGADDAATGAAIASLQEQRASLAIVGENPGRLIGSAIPPIDPSSLGLVVFIVAGLVGGVILAIIAVAIWSRLDPRMRYSDRLDNLGADEIIVVRSSSDTEGFRWLLRAVDSVAGRDEPLNPSIAIFGTGGIDTGDIAQSIAASALSEGRSVLLYSEDEFSPDDLNWGWPDRQVFAGDDGLVIIDAQRVAPGARRATLGDRVTLSVVVTTRVSKIARVRATLADLRGSAKATVVALFVTKPRASGSPSHADRRRSADAAAGTSDGGSAQHPATGEWHRNDNRYPQSLVDPAGEQLSASATADGAGKPSRRP